MFSSDAGELAEYFEGREAEMLKALSHLVDLESPTGDLSAIENFALALELYVESETGAGAEIIRRDASARPHVLAHLGSRTDILFVGHFDTVYSLGTTDANPFRIEGNRAYGAGVLDMKSGLVIMTEVAKYLAKEFKKPNISLFFNSDEEMASFDSLHLLRELAREPKLIVIFEFTGDENEVKIGSRGNRPYRVTVHGRGGHSAYPEQSSNPVVGLLEVASALRELDPEGNRLIPTMVEASERSNVIPDDASMTFDVRFSDPKVLEKIDEKLRAIRFSDPHLSLTYSYVHDVPLHKRDPDSYAFQLVHECGKEFGMDIRGIEARGTSDLNWIGEINPNAIEALGACGGGAHAADREYVYVDSLKRRAALTALIAKRALSDALDETHSGQVQGAS